MCQLPSSLSALSHTFFLVFFCLNSFVIVQFLAAACNTSLFLIHINSTMIQNNEILKSITSNRQPKNPDFQRIKKKLLMSFCYLFIYFRQSIGINDSLTSFQMKTIASMHLLSCFLCSFTLIRIQRS